MQSKDDKHDKHLLNVSIRKDKASKCTLKYDSRVNVLQNMTQNITY